MAHPLFIMVFAIFALQMKLGIHIGILLFFVVSTALAQGRYHPGETVPKPYLKVNGYEAFFTISPIAEELKAQMRQNTFKSKNGVSWDRLRYLRVLHCDAEGNSIVGEMVCSAAIAEDLLEIFKELYQAAYPIEKMRLVDYYGGDDDASMSDNNTSCFNQRASASGGMVSKHSYGLAVDVNPKYNPYFKRKANGQIILKPEGSADYLDRGEILPYMIKKGDLCYRLFKKHGFHWGGEWISGKDYQHFEK